MEHQLFVGSKEPMQPKSPRIPKAKRSYPSSGQKRKGLPHDHFSSPGQFNATDVKKQSVVGIKEPMQAKKTRISKTKTNDPSGVGTKCVKPIGIYNHFSTKCVNPSQNLDVQAPAASTSTSVALETSSRTMKECPRPVPNSVIRNGKGYIQRSLIQEAIAMNKKPRGSSTN